MEKVPKKKARRALKKTTLLLILLLIAAAAGAGAYFLRPGITLPETSETETVMLLDRPVEEIASIAITPPEGAAYPLVRSGDGFLLLSRENMALRENALNSILDTVSYLPAQETITDTPRLSDFGLENPWLQVVIGYADGSKITLSVGNLAPDDQKIQRYCLLNGGGTVYTILADDANAFAHDLDYLRAFDQPQLDASLLDRIEISGNLVFSAFYTPSGWQMEAPYAYPLSVSKTDSLLNKIESMAFDACMGDAEEAELSAFGLDAPALNVILTQAATVITGETTDGRQVTMDVPERQYHLSVGGETGKSGVYVLWEGRVYRASNFLLGFWKELDVDSLLLREPVNFLVNNLDRLAFTAGGVTRAYRVEMVESITQNNQIATDEYGQILYECAVRREGAEQDMDAEKFLSWYTRLASLTAGGTLPDGHTPSGEPRGVIVLTNSRLTRTIAFYPWDALHDAVAVDGVARFYVEKTWLDGVMDAP